MLPTRSVFPPLFLSPSFSFFFLILFFFSVLSFLFPLFPALLFYLFPVSFSSCSFLPLSSSFLSIGPFLLSSSPLFYHPPSFVGFSTFLSRLSFGLCLPQRLCAYFCSFLSLSLVVCLSISPFYIISLYSFPFHLLLFPSFHLFTLFFFLHTPFSVPSRPLISVLRMFLLSVLPIPSLFSPPPLLFSLRSVTFFLLNLHFLLLSPRNYSKESPVHSQPRTLHLRTCVQNRHICVSNNLNFSVCDKKKTRLKKGQYPCLKVL